MKQKLSYSLFGLLMLIGIPLWAQKENDTIRYNQYGVRVDRIPLIAERRNGTLVFESRDQKQRIWFDTRVQVDGAIFTGDTYNEIGNGTAIRRARLAMKTELNEKWYGELDLDFANSELELKDAYLAYFPNQHWMIRAGNFKESFSMESTTTSRYLTFMERPMAVSAFAPSRHIGLALQYNYNWLLAIGGVYFQNVSDLEERTYSVDNNKDFGTDEGYSLTGKLVFMPLYNKSGYGIHIGAATSYRTPKTDAEIPGSVRYSTRSLTNINRKKYLDTDNILNVDYTWQNGFELAVYYHNFRLQGEYLLTDVHRKNDLPNENFNGFYIMGSCMLLGGEYQYNQRDGEFTQPSRGRKWGDIELALRYDMLDLNSSMEGLMGGAGEGITAGINYHVNSSVKVMFNYAYLNHDRYANGKGKLFVGHDVQGNLTKNPFEVIETEGKAGEDFSMFSIRFEIDF
jgi:phosphate-selective porin OprO/OprP